MNKNRHASRPALKMHQPQPSPPWLRGLKEVKAQATAELRGRTPEEGLRIGLALMAHALNSLRESLQRERPQATEVSMARQVHHLLARFARLDDRWVKRCRDERAALTGGLRDLSHHESSTGVEGKQVRRRSTTAPGARNKNRSRRPW